MDFIALIRHVFVKGQFETHRFLRELVTTMALACPPNKPITLFLKCSTMTFTFWEMLWSGAPTDSALILAFLASTCLSASSIFV